jgi:hypothetical protein
VDPVKQFVVSVVQGLEVCSHHLLVGFKSVQDSPPSIGCAGVRLDGTRVKRSSDLCSVYGLRSEATIGSSNPKLN